MTCSYAGGTSVPHLTRQFNLQHRNNLLSPVQLKHRCMRVSHRMQTHRVTAAAAVAAAEAEEAAAVLLLLLEQDVHLV